MKIKSNNALVVIFAVFLVMFLWVGNLIAEHSASDVKYKALTKEIVSIEEYSELAGDTADRMLLGENKPEVKTLSVGKLTAAELSVLLSSESRDINEIEIKI